MVLATARSECELMCSELGTERLWTAGLPGRVMALSLTHSITHTYVILCTLNFSNHLLTSGVQRGVWGVQTPHPRNSEGPPKSYQTQPDCENLKIAEFRTPTPPRCSEKRQ